MEKMMEKRMSVLDVEESSIPIDRATLRRIINGKEVDVRRASIREMNNLIDTIECELGVRYIRMEFGIPGLLTHPIAVDAEIAALRDRQVGHVYAPFEGLPALKEEAARFIKLFVNLDIPAKCCIPVIGAMEGCFASLALAGRMGIISDATRGAIQPIISTGITSLLSVATSHPKPLDTTDAIASKRQEDLFARIRWTSGNYKTEFRSGILIG